MKIADTIARYLLALLFTVFGLNGFLHFIPQPPLSGLAGQFFTVMTNSGYLIPVFALQVLCGIFFLLNRYIPLAMTLIGPVIVNIMIFHITMNPEGIGPGALAVICWLILFAHRRNAFAGIFQSRY